MKARADAIASRTITVHDDSTSGQVNAVASEYNDALIRSGRQRGVNSPYIPGHCFFSSSGFSQSHGLGVGLGEHSHTDVARRIRTLLADFYANPSYSGLFRPWMSPTFVWPGREQDRLNVPGVGLSVTNDVWHRQFLNDRASMMATINVTLPSSSLWEYSGIIDHVGFISPVSF